MLWSEILIDKGILYLSHFLGEDSHNYKSLLPHDQFLNKWNLDLHDITYNDYSNIRIAIKGYCRNVGILNNFDLIDIESTVPKVFSIHPKPPVKAGGIRNLMTIRVDPKTLTPLKEWCKDLKITNNIDWVVVLNNTFITTTNNYKLIQFQYKLLTINLSRFSTNC